MTSQIHSEIYWPLVFQNLLDQVSKIFSMNLIICVCILFLNSYFHFQIFRLGANRRTEVIDEFKANSVQVNDFLRACISQNAQRYVCRSHFLFLKCPLLCIPYLFSTSGKPPPLTVYWTGILRGHFLEIEMQQWKKKNCEIVPSCSRVLEYSKYFKYFKIQMLGLSGEIANICII